MKFLLKELVNPNTTVLNDTQKAILLTTHVAPTDRVAFDNTSSSLNLAKARDSLRALNMLLVGDGAQQLTDTGREMLKYHNLIDDTDAVTDDGQAILDQTENVSKNFSDADPQTESFNFLKSLY